MISLQRRLGLGIGAGLALVLLAVWVAVGWSTLHMSEEYVASRLEHDAENLLAGLRVKPKPSINAESVGTVYRRPHSGHYYTVTVGDTTLHSRSLWDDTLQVADRDGSYTVRLAGPQGQPLLVYVRRYERDGQRALIAVAEDLGPMETTIDEFQNALGFIFVAALVLVLVGTRLGIRRGLAPLDDLRRDVERIERGETTQLPAEAPAEVAPLVDALNRLLRLTAQRLARSRSALGDLAHALKTPLALIVHTAEDRDSAMDEVTRARLLKEAERIRELVNRELARARVAGAASPGQHFRPEEDVPALANVVRRLYAERGLSITWSVPARSFAVDREDMLEMLGNLLDNAAKWARSRVHVTVDDDPALHLVVEDDGPGCPPEKLDAITRRGVRLDEETPGTGLGLSIVRTIVSDYGGSLELGRSDTLGGLRVAARFPTHA